ncbi:MAG: VWA domain-containing protein [Nanoarchaeota archaeon]|nr:VWA domain-containing protein [Nanoarchaeota archaeon]MBU1270494.1 VWA domain-containing protein [Nanoarchaeota archaeon]MBU1603872.1 VWA domain-containing protein [Nanoarchaeota archaeon]MBU2442723.1 VWA domain-containing protein [Nanoarchaeota archaeon]
MTEITFNHPLYLWLLLSIPVVVISHFYLLRYSKKKAMKFANFETIKRVTGKSLLTKNLTVLTIRIFILLFVILAVSGSVLWYEGKTNNHNFIIAIDTSASMLTKDIHPNRLEAAKEYATRFLTSLKTDAKVGLITFSAVTFVNQVPTTNKNDIKKAIQEIKVAEAGGTDIPGAIITGTNLLATSDKGKTIILLSDGSSTIGTFLEDSIRQAVEYAQNDHVIIHTIGTGTKKENPIGYLPEYYNVTSVYNEQALQDISNKTGGTYFPGAAAQQIDDAFKTISEDADKAYLNINLSPWLMIIAVILLFIEWGLINTRFRKIP